LAVTTLKLRAARTVLTIVDAMHGPCRGRAALRQVHFIGSGTTHISTPGGRRAASADDGRFTDARGLARRALAAKREVRAT
jgi:hypothetical protein